MAVSCKKCGIIKEDSKSYRFHNFISTEKFRSSIINSYCSNCEDFTMWFGAVGMLDINEKVNDIGRDIASLKFFNIYKEVHINNFNQINLELNYREGKEFQQEINDLDVEISSRSDNWFFKFLNSSIINALKRKKEVKIADNNYIIKEIKKIKEKYLKDYEKSKSFYQDLKAKPRCLECGKTYSSSKHKCGEELIYLSDKFNVKLNIAPSQILYTFIEYDSMGFVQKKYYERNGEQVEPSLPSTFIEWVALTNKTKKGF